MTAKPKRDLPACDRLGTKKDGLKWKWRWPKWHWIDSDYCWHGGPGYQIATATETIDVECEQDVKLTCVQWPEDNGYSYEATVTIADNMACSSHVPFEKGFATRLEAQRSAEEMVMKLGQQLYRLNRK